MNEPNPPQTRSESSQKPAFGLIRTGLLIAGSALLGGLAVVLWHRKSLATLRQPVPEPNRPPTQPDAETE
jgi:hypothetical protein